MSILQKARDSIPLRRTNYHSSPGTEISILVVEHLIIRMRLSAILHLLLFLKFLVILRQILALTEPGVKTNERLTGLALIHVHRHINFDVEQIIDNFARAYPR